MRGKVDGMPYSSKGLGITPAHAGKSYDERYEKSLGKDHPRTCGEKVEHIRGGIDKEGSPPHMRGKEL